MNDRLIQQAVAFQAPEPPRKFAATAMSRSSSSVPMWHLSPSKSELREIAFGVPFRFGQAARLTDRRSNF